MCAFGPGTRSLAPELKCLADVVRTDRLGPIQIRNRARDAQDTVVASRRKGQARERQVEYSARIRVEVCPRAQLTSLQPDAARARFVEAR